MGKFLKIGSLELKNNIIAAPMAGITDAPYRYLASRMGAGLTVTEMATSKGLIQGQRRTLRIISTHPDARPYAVQLFGCDPAVLADAARIAVEKGADVIDLNAACPVRKVVRSGSGAELLRNLDLLRSILKAMRKALEAPLTLKIRSGWNKDSIIASQVAEMAREEGVDALTLHPRTASQGFSGSADWTLIEKVASASGDMTVIGSGDIRNATDSIDMLDRTGCDAVMVARAAMGNPFIFREIAALLEGKRLPKPAEPSEVGAMALDHLDMMLEHHERRVAISLWRKHLCWYARGAPSATHLRRVVFTIDEEQELRELTQRFFGMNEKSFSLAGSAKP